MFKQVNHNRENPDPEDPVEPTNDDSDSSDEDSEDSVWTTPDEDNEIPEDVGNDIPPNETPSNNDRVAGAAILTSFVPLQLVAHIGQGQPPVIVFDNELCNSPISGEFLGFAHLSGNILISLFFVVGFSALPVIISLGHTCIYLG